MTAPQEPVLMTQRQAQEHIERFLGRSTVAFSDALRAIAEGRAKVVPAGGEPVAWLVRDGVGMWKVAWDGGNTHGAIPVYCSPPPAPQPPAQQEAWAGAAPAAGDALDAAWPHELEQGYRMRCNYCNGRISVCDAAPSACSAKQARTAIAAQRGKK